MITERPELWTAGERTKANLAAMRLAAELARAPRALTDADKLVLASYSGWGGLSIKKAEGQFPADFPRPEERGLIHEYYTPSLVTAEVARVVKPLLPGLSVDGKVRALEPSAGIGRFVRAFEGPGYEAVQWHAVEYSALSAAMLRALRPHLDLFEGPFERWVNEREAELAGAIDLVVANPPYGARGPSKTEDENRDYRLKDAYAYFLRRGLDLLAPNGLGVFVIPSGFLTGTGRKHRELRDAVLRRHHLSAAYRLPSGLFPGATLVTDLLFFRARGGELADVDPTDQFILEGRYFKDFPTHILGKEVGLAGDDDDQTKVPRWGYQVEGEFTGLPDLEERPRCAACIAVPLARPKLRLPVGPANDNEAMPSRLATASSLGMRVHAFLAAVAAQESEEPSLAWQELHDGLVTWVKGADVAPSLDAELVKLARSDQGAARFLAAFEPRSTKPIPALRERPVWSPRYQGRADDVVARAEWLFRQHGRLARAELGRVDLAPLWKVGWAEDEPGELVPSDVYETGFLWPKVDRARARAERGDAQAAAQVQRLIRLIKPATFEEIGGISPRAAWVPLQLVEGWIAEALNRGHKVSLKRFGLTEIAGTEYDELSSKGGDGVSPEAMWCLGWINHDKELFKPPRRRGADGEKQLLDDARLEIARAWEQAFRAWCEATEERRTAIEHAYQRAMQGYRAPSYLSAPLMLARWAKNGPKLHAYQAAGVRRLQANRRGLVAYDVGLGKTYTGLATLALARQEGWARRPVILVPPSIAWKWVRDIKRVLPDYRVGVVGSVLKTIQRGERKGQVTSDTDTPAQRAQTWSRFMGGEFDCIVCTYPAFSRTRMQERSVRAYAEKSAAIQRDIKLRRRNAKNTSGELSERQEAILREGTAAWVAEQLELPAGWSFDPGITWDDIGVDLLIVDEGQNFKNLHMPEAREHGVPRFMGNAGEGSKRAWQLEFRCASVRHRTGGAGVVLLSATPAKNSPLEFYNLLGYVAPEAFEAMGIYDPEQFVDRFCRIEPREVVNSAMEVETRSAVVGFQNLHELRDIVFRLGEFKTAQEVGLKLPVPEVRRIEVDLDARQEAKTSSYVAAIENLLEHPSDDGSGSLLGYLARLALVAVHADLDEKYDWRTAKNVPSPHSPKFDALAAEVLKNRTCGHIVFCDNVAAHWWIRDVLVEAGIPAERIAILNANVATATEDRQRIAQEFNGDPEAGEPPRYDVVIANAVAYEGVDLQKRTCAIHHIDLPWEPATLEQRNGRGMRQGNSLAAVNINYYFARRSQDGMRFNLIQGKRGWMAELLESQARDTNNPGAQQDLGPEEVLLLISRDPEKTLARLSELKARREEDARRKVAAQATATLRTAAGYFARARVQRDPAEAARLRSEGEQRLEDLMKVDAAAWPWKGWAGRAREHAMLVPPKGDSPVYEGLRVGRPSAIDPTVIEHGEFGRLHEGKIGFRAAGTAIWRMLDVQAVAELRLAPEHVAGAWPADDIARAVASLKPRLGRFRGSPRYTWEELCWTYATDAFRGAMWEALGADIASAMAESWEAEDLNVPVLVGGKLHAGFGRRGELVPFTELGWAQFLALAPASGLKFGQLEVVSVFWWGRRIPRDLLSAGQPKSKRGPVSIAAPSARPSVRAPAASVRASTGVTSVQGPATRAPASRPAASSPAPSGARTASVRVPSTRTPAAAAVPSARAPSARAPSVPAPSSPADPRLRRDGDKLYAYRAYVEAAEGVPGLTVRREDYGDLVVETAAGPVLFSSLGSKWFPGQLSKAKRVEGSSEAIAIVLRSVPPPGATPDAPSVHAPGPSSTPSSQREMDLPTPMSDRPPLTARGEAVAESQRSAKRTKALVTLQDGERREVEILGRDGDLIVHLAIGKVKSAERYALTHEPTGARLHGFESVAAALMFAWDVNQPEPRAAFDAAVAAHSAAMAATVAKHRDAKHLQRAAKRTGATFSSLINARTPTREARYIAAKAAPASGPRVSVRPASSRRPVSSRKGLATLDELGIGTDETALDALGIGTDESALDALGIGTDEGALDALGIGTDETALDALGIGVG